MHRQGRIVFLGCIGMCGVVCCAPLEQRARAIVIPVIEMEDASPREILEYIRLQARERDPEGLGINMLFRFSPAGRRIYEESTFTLQLRNVPFSEVVHYLHLLTGLKYRYDPYALILFDTAGAGEKMDTRVYNINAGVLHTRRTRARPEKIDGLEDDDGDGD
ncbi:MAG: hypothetical protein JXR77_06000 [Lentisphaeria bacterium]|nr:hypothetical protein [Lentisphaeria bacterium]